LSCSASSSRSCNCCIEIRVAHLLEDVGVPGFVDLEGLPAVGADDVVHGFNP
jgi:hypothetical protein